MSKQNRRQFISRASLAGAGVITSTNLSIPKTNKMLVHHVFFWLKNPSSKEDLDKLLTGLRSLKDIKTVKQIHIGVPASTESRDVVDASYHASELLFFENLAGQKSYQGDLIHQKFISDCSHLWSKVIVYDSIDV